MIRFYYEICESADIGTLKSEVQLLLRAGWKLAGGISISTFEGSLGELLVWYSQALILEMQEQDDQ